MSTVIDEKLKLWASGRYGVGVDQIKTVELDLRTEGDGCCELCYSEVAVFHVDTVFFSGKRRTLTYGDYDLKDFFEEVLAA